MQWKDLESDIKLRDLTEVLSELDCFSALRIAANLMHGVRIFALSSCVTTVMSHVIAHKKEVGGLLVGQVWKQASKNARVFSKPLITIIEAIPSTEFRNSSVSLEMGSNLWSRFNDRVSGEGIVVGWYHSHPNLGAFFSGTDRRTQKAFFNHQYSLGWVIDPFRKEQKVFIGGDSDEYRPSIMEVDHGLEMAKNN